MKDRELVTSNETIGTLQECKDAINSLDLKFKLILDSSYPKGCFREEGGPYAIWNTNTGDRDTPGNEHKDEYQICKVGKSIY